MSNIKLIDGCQVNLIQLNKVTYWKREKKFCLVFHYFGGESQYIGEKIGHVAYSSKEEVEARIKQILENQNSDDIEI